MSKTVGDSLDSVEPEVCVAYRKDSRTLSSH